MYFTGRYCALLSVAVVFASLVGCGSNTTLQGKFTFNGEKVDNGSVTLIPKQDDGRIKIGSFVGDGTYEIPEGKGLQPGTYKVELRWSKKTGKKIPSDDMGSEDETVQVIPEKYNKNSTLELTVTAGRNVKDFEISDK